jgi:hypothetical protein
MTSYQIKTWLDNTKMDFGVRGGFPTQRDPRDAVNIVSVPFATGSKSTGVK